MSALPIFAWTNTPPPEPRRHCSHGCHLLPEWAKFDPHTGHCLNAALRALDVGKHPARSSRARLLTVLAACGAAIGS